METLIYLFLNVCANKVKTRKQISSSHSSLRAGQERLQYIITKRVQTRRKAFEKQLYPQN